MTEENDTMTEELPLISEELSNDVDYNDEFDATELLDKTEEEVAEFFEGGCSNE